jgi:hypothetical protein
MKKFYVPTNSLEDWKPLLAEPDKHWRNGYSAKSLAYCWQTANNFPMCVRKVFSDSGIDLFMDIEMLLAFPEYKVPLQGGRRASQNDIFVLAKKDNALVSMMIEGKASESFDKTVAERRSDSSPGKTERINYLCNLLHLDISKIDNIRYQLIHRTASAIIEARKFNAQNALMLVHSFSPEDIGFEDYRNFLGLFGVRGSVNSLVRSGYFLVRKDNFSNVAAASRRSEG